MKQSSSFARHNKRYAEHGYWSIGTYYGPSSVCVNYIKGWEVVAHRHDYFGFLPRWVRIGWYIRSISKELGL